MEDLNKITTLRNKQTGQIVSPDMLFLNDYSDGGRSNILADWDLLPTVMTGLHPYVSHLSHGITIEVRASKEKNIS